MSGVDGKGAGPTPREVPRLEDVDCPPQLRERIEAAIARYPEVRSAAIPALWAVQEHYGWCTPEGIRQAAAVLGVTPAHLEGVASFYDLFKLAPSGRHRVLVCTNISCWLNGGDELLDAFREAAGVEPGGGRSADGELAVEPFECLGACDIAPMAAIDLRYYGPLSAGDAREAVARLRAGEPDPLPAKRLASRPKAGDAS